MSINKVLISGNLTRDGELRSTSSGTSVLGMGVAVTDRRRNTQTGEWEDVPNFVDCTLFGARAEALAQYLRKGTKVFIEGKLRWNQWEKDGQRRTKLEVVVDEIEFTNPQHRVQGPPSQQYPQAQQRPVQQYQQPMQYSQQQPYMQQAMSAAQQPAQAGLYDEEIPF